MVRFKPKYENKSTGTATSYLENLDAITSVPVSYQLNEKNKDFKCEKHPDIESLILVSTRPSPSFEIASVCCPEFRKEIEQYLKLS